MKPKTKKDKFGIVHLTTNAEWYEKINDQYYNVRGLSNITYPSQEDLFIYQEIKKLKL